MSRVRLTIHSSRNRFAARPNSDGCISYELLQNRTEQTDFTFIEAWKSDAAIDAHLSTKHIRDALTKLHGLVSGEPDIKRYSVVTGAN